MVESISISECNPKFFSEHIVGSSLGNVEGNSTEYVSKTSLQDSSISLILESTPSLSRISVVSSIGEINSSITLDSSINQIEWVRNNSSQSTRKSGKDSLLSCSKIIRWLMWLNLIIDNFIGQISDKQVN